MMRWRLLHLLGLLGMVLTLPAFLGGLALLFFAHEGAEAALTMAEHSMQDAISLLDQGLALSQPLQQLSEQSDLLSQSSIIAAGETLASLGVLDMFGLGEQLGEWQALAEGAHRLNDSGFFAQAEDFRSQSQGWLTLVQTARELLLPVLVGFGLLLALLSVWWWMGQWALVRLAREHLKP